VRLDGIHHVAYAVEDLDAALPLFTRRFGMELQARESLPDQGVEAVALGLGHGHLELIRPLDPDGPVARFLARRGPGLHHVGYQVADLPAALDELRSDGAELIDDAPRRGLGGNLIAFVHPRSSGGVLTELVQEDGRPPPRGYG
jgi:methylmalonyl-CoA/ethylmalonyl-CoA epimerase